MLLARYAYGKTLTDVPSSTGDRGGTTAQNPCCLNSCEKGDPTYDLRQRFTANVVYESPFGRSRRWMTRGGAADLLLGGWDMASIVSRQSGRANYLGGPKTVANPSLNLWFNTTAFAAPAAYTPGNLGYGTMLGPGTLNWDFSVYKTFSVSERHRPQFRTEFFNVLNHPNLGNPGLTIGTANFGKNHQRG